MTNAQDQKHTTRLDDHSDPVYKDVDGVKARNSIQARHAKWRAMQPASVARLFCVHGSYIGSTPVTPRSCSRCFS